MSGQLRVSYAATYLDRFYEAEIFVFPGQELGKYPTCQEKSEEDVHSCSLSPLHFFVFSYSPSPDLSITQYFVPYVAYDTTIYDIW